MTCTCIFHCVYTTAYNIALTRTLPVSNWISRNNTTDDVRRLGNPPTQSTFCAFYNTTMQSLALCTHEMQLYIDKHVGRYQRAISDRGLCQTTANPLTRMEKLLIYGIFRNQICKEAVYVHAHDSRSCCAIRTTKEMSMLEGKYTVYVDNIHVYWQIRVSANYSELECIIQVTEMPSAWERSISSTRCQACGFLTGEVLLTRK